VLFVPLFVFSVGVLAVSGLFWEYVDVHWAAMSSHSSASREDAERQVKRTVLSIGLLSLGSSLLLVSRGARARASPSRLRP
jgi:hypothetical protein